MKKHPEALIKHFILNNLMPDSVLIRKKKARSVPSGQTSIAYSQCQLSRDGQDVQSTGTWLCLGSSFMSATAAGWSNGRDSMVTLWRECHSCQTLPSATNNPQIQRLYLIVKMMSGCRAWLGKERDWTVFSSTSLLHSGSSDFVICRVEIYLRVGDPKLPLDTMKG